MPKLFRVATCQKFCENILTPRPRLNYYDLKVFITAVLTLNFDLDLPKVNSSLKFGIDAENGVGLVFFDKSQQA